MTREMDYFKTFCKVSKAFGTAVKKNDLLNLIVDSAIESMQGKAACLFLADEEEDCFIPTAQAGLSDNYLHANPLKARKIVSALEKEGYLYFADATADPRLENHAAKKAEGIATILTVPVRVKDRIIGVLSLYSASRREFVSDEIEFLQALAEQGGIAIENNRLRRRMQKNAMLFLDLASSINSSLDIKQVLSNLTTNICETLGMKAALIRLLDEDSGSLKVVANHGLSEAFLKIGASTTTETANRALKGETMVISDATTDERIQFKAEMKKEGIVSMVVTPILARDKVIGVMRLYSGIQREFPSDLMVMVEALAHQGGLAIQNASMFLQLQEEKKNLEEDIWSHRAWF
ncbi:GAF domain protein [Desulfosarcina cetonica]|uniref:GAF domain-containing protein n=1 Tax=Desulfosarcina cetonica TaxID=90730 RepID=UPI0006D10EDC|nr:GAF domain-containing protein [Desulfosarcina cetonica]VTR69171.1 GAF domain protein [Desulfosarcina cetonica]